MVWAVEWLGVIGMLLSTGFSEAQAIPGNADAIGLAVPDIDGDIVETVPVDEDTMRPWQGLPPEPTNWWQGADLRIETGTCLPITSGQRGDHCSGAAWSQASPPVCLAPHCPRSCAHARRVLSRKRSDETNLID